MSSDTSGMAPAIRMLGPAPTQLSLTNHPTISPSCKRRAGYSVLSVRRILAFHIRKCVPSNYYKFATLVTVTGFNMQPRVSVIMIAHNEERYIGEAVESILRQDFDDFELIIVDDGSTDGTRSLIQGFSQRDNRVKVHFQENAGSGPARNAGLRHATGEYVTFVDADDVFDSHMLSKLHAATENNGADIAVCNASVFLDGTNEDLYNLDGHVGLQVGTYRTKDIEERLFQIFNSCPWGKIFKASLISDNSLTFQAMARSNELRFVYSAFASSKIISVIDDTLIRYRIGKGGSLIDKAVENPLCDLMAYDALRDSLRQGGWLDEKRQGISRSIDNACICMVVSNMVRYLSGAPEAAAYFLDTYLAKYERAWDLKDIPHYYHYLYSKPRALAYRRMRTLNERGIAWVSAGTHISRSEGRALAKKSLLMAKVLIATLPGSPYRRRGA